MAENGFSYVPTPVLFEIVLQEPPKKHEVFHFTLSLSRRCKTSQVSPGMKHHHLPHERCFWILTFTLKNLPL